MSSASSGVQNVIVLMDSVSDIGGIEAWITMDEADMMKVTPRFCLLHCEQHVGLFSTVIREDANS